MSATDATELLRPGLLEGVRIVLAGAQAQASEGQGEPLSTAVGAACGALGARVHDCSLFAGGQSLDEGGIQALVEQALEELGGVELLCVDAAGLFEALAQEGSRVGLVGCLDLSWSITRAVAGGSYIPCESGGRVVYLAPAAAVGPSAPSPHVGAVLAGLENLARTLSIEWARYGITPVAIAPGAGTTAGEVAALTAFLASPAGAYFSGCLMDLRGPGGQSPS